MNQENKHYAVALLLSCIDTLSRELALKTGIEPETIANRTLLDLTLQMQKNQSNTNKVLSYLETNYAYSALINRLVELID